MPFHLRLRSFLPLLAAATLALLLATAATASASYTKQVQRQDGATLTLHGGQSLTIATARTAGGRATRRRLAGHRWYVSCAGLDDSGRSYRLVAGRIAWPKAARVLRLHLRDAMHADWCIVEESSGSDVLAGYFTKRTSDYPPSVTVGAALESAIDWAFPHPRKVTSVALAAHLNAQKGLQHDFDAAASGDVNPTDPARVAVWADVRGHLRLSQIAADGTVHDATTALLLGVMRVR